jgi:hypothetical protein
MTVVHNCVLWLWDNKTTDCDAIFISSYFQEIINKNTPVKILKKIPTGVLLLWCNKDRRTAGNSQEFAW